jgi:DNA-binding transcriptional regulator YdaS (Cro superfamily)
MAAMNPLDLAIKRAGGVGKLASAIGCKPNVVSNWRKRRIPDTACPAIERATGVRVEALRADLPWHRDGESIFVRYDAQQSQSKYG